MEFYTLKNKTNKYLEIKIKENKNIISSMFDGCSSLTNLPDISKWNTNKVIDMSCIFKECSLLTNLPDLSKWDTNNVTDMNSMFY